MLGLLYGSQYDEFASQRGRIVGDISTIALIFIMFYGGFGTRWKSARPIAVEAGLLATIGVALTAAFVGLFCHYALGWAWLGSFLMGAVFLLKRISFQRNGFDIAIALVSYALPDLIGGNGYLSAYILQASCLAIRNSPSGSRWFRFSMLSRA